MTKTQAWLMFLSFSVCFSHQCTFFKSRSQFHCLVPVSCHLTTVLILSYLFTIQNVAFLQEICMLSYICSEKIVSLGSKSLFCGGREGSCLRLFFKCSSSFFSYQWVDFFATSQEKKIMFSRDRR